MKEHTGKPDMYLLAEQQCAISGKSLEHELWLVVQKVMRRAQEGDTAAAKMLIEKMFRQVPVEVDFQPKLTEEERAARLRVLFESVQQRINNDAVRALLPVPGREDVICGD